MNNTKRLIAMLLLAALLLTALAACGGTPASSAPAVSAVSAVSAQEGTSLGDGSTQFAFLVTDGDGNTESFDIHTDETIVGDALQSLGLIEGEDGEFGLYVKTVNGITADYDTDGTYWAFYIDGEYATAGVDATDVVPGATYEFRVEQ